MSIVEAPPPLRVFVAMPGTTMGDEAAYKDPESVKKNLLVPVAHLLESRLGRRVELVIEKDKLSAGDIHASMFAEAYNAEVYIADLTGANPNVYLELGVRWAVCDRVTVPIVQNAKDLKFNVASSRAIVYGPENIVDATAKIAAAIESGLKPGAAVDSVVRQNSALVTITRREWEQLRDEIERLRHERGDDLRGAAKAASVPQERLTLLRKAVEVNPGSVDAWLELGMELRSVGKYDDAIAALTKALRIAPGDGRVNRELGVTHSKYPTSGGAGREEHLNSAVRYLREAVRLLPNDAEAWSNLGGVLRKIGMAGAPDRYDQKALQECYESYAHAHELDRYSLYAGLNVARLDLLLSRWEPDRRARARDSFRKQIHLARFAVEEQPDDAWRRFDLADALLFAEESEAQAAYDEAISRVPAEKRRDTISSVLGPLNDFSVAGVLEGSQLAQVQTIVAKLQSAASGA